MGNLVEKPITYKRERQRPRVRSAAAPRCSVVDRVAKDLGTEPWLVEASKDALYDRGRPSHGKTEGLLDLAGRQPATLVVTALDDLTDLGSIPSSSTEKIRRSDSMVRGERILYVVMMVGVIIWALTYVHCR